MKGYEVLEQAVSSVSFVLYEGSPIFLSIPFCSL